MLCDNPIPKQGIHVFWVTVEGMGRERERESDESPNLKGGRGKEDMWYWYWYRYWYCLVPLPKNAFAMQYETQKNNYSQLRVVVRRRYSFPI